MCSARWIQTEEMTSKLGFLSKHPTTGKPIPSPFINIGINYMTTGSFAQVNKEKAPTLAARDYKDAPIVNVGDNCRYIVRRLTPTECARLQGFPDNWCSNLGTENPAMDELRFWYNVFADYGKVMGKKPKSLKAIATWLKNPHSDSAEYKMWGNGVALPCVVFVLKRIQDISHKQLAIIDTKSDICSTKTKEEVLQNEN